MQPRVLIVDDSWSMRQTLRLLLSPDFQCALAEDGASALVQALEAPPDLIISDVSMEGMDGYELCRRVRAEPALRHVPIVFISGHPPRRDCNPTADAYLIKPVQPAVLVAQIHELLQPRYLAAAQSQK